MREKKQLLHFFPHPTAKRTNKPTTRKKSSRKGRAKLTEMRGEFFKGLAILLTLSLLVMIVHRQYCIESKLDNFNRIFVRHNQAVKALE
jgi:hypothetical protein